MQGLADGYFVLPYTLGNYLAGDEDATPSTRTTPSSRTPRRRCEARIEEAARRSRASGPWTRSTASSARSCGSTAAWPATRRASRRRSQKIPALREEFWKDVNVAGADEELNQSLEKAGRVADFLEFGELMCLDALAARGVLRRPLPRGAPDAGRRGAARRREVLPRRRLGVHGRRQDAGAGTRAARVRERPPRDSGATSNAAP